MTGYDLPEGPDWWQASDGKWYPPELRSSSPTPIATPSPSPTSSGSSSPNSTPGIGIYPAATNSQPGFFARLFDLSFSNFITPSIIKLLYILGILVSSLTGLALLVAGINEGSSFGTFVALIFGPGVALLGIIYIRVLLELIMVLFRIENNSR